MVTFSCDDHSPWSKGEVYVLKMGGGGGGVWLDSYEEK